MRNILPAILTLVLINLCIQSANASQPGINSDKILYQSGTLKTEQNFSEISNLPVPATDLIDGHYYRLFQFNTIPGPEAQKNLLHAGINLLNYIPNNAFFASVEEGADLTSLKDYDIRTVLRIENVQKSSRAIRENNIPDYAIRQAGFVDLIVQYFSDMNVNTVNAEFASRKIEIIKSYEANHQVRIRIPLNLIPDLLQIPFVKYVQEIESPSLPDDTQGRSLHRSNMINSDFGAGPHFDGSGVSISLADDGEVGPHIDFTGRITQLISTGPGGSHGDMTGGIAVGAGNLDPQMRGMATGAHLYVHDIDDGINPYDHIYNAPYYYTTYGAVVTSTSYSQGCNAYDAIASTGDQIAHQNPYLNFVFSAGNSGQSDCGYGTNAAWGTITGGFKQGKNTIACGNLDAYGVLDNSSSRGPSADGRVKPDICSNGKDQNSTRDENRYQVGGGTSAACPGIAGITAQLVQAYREMNLNPEAPSALIKASLLNSAEDIGNPGPDFTYGWGRVNAYRALSTLQEQRFLLDSIGQSATKFHTIQVPANTRQLKCMLYWLDLEGDPVAAIALVNDLDLTVQDPSSTTYQPWILDPTPLVSSVTAVAIRGADHLNNMEQVTIDNPAAGNYTLEVNGAILPFGNQEYYIVWEFLTDEITLTYPNGGEGFVPGETETLRWDAFGNTDLFDLDYSDDNGSSWTSIATGVSASTRQFNWLVPATISDKVLLRLSRGVISDVSDAKLAIMNLPTDLNVDFACLGTTQFSWTAAPGATAYEVSKLGAEYMDSVTTVFATSVQLSLADSVDTWLSVRSLGSTTGKGRRAVAIHKLPGLLNCTFSDDMNLKSIQNPVAGLLFPCQNLSSISFTVELRNDGINEASGFSISYSINGGTAITEIYTDTLLHGATVIYTFSTPADLSAPGQYLINFNLSYIGDANSTNNSIIQQVEVLNSASLPVFEDFQSSTFPPQGWALNSSGVTYTWLNKSGITGSDGTTTSAAWFDNYSYNNPGARDYLTTYLADLTGIAKPLLTFDVAYSVYSGNADGLGLEASTDCGTNFLPTSYLKAGSSLASAPSSNTDWVPTQAAHWRNDSLNLDAYANTLLMLRFVNINDFGNNLFIDNVNIINNLNISIQGPDQPVFLALYPNPSSGLFTLDINNLPSEDISVAVYDMNGREVLTRHYANTPHTFKATIGLAEFGKGVYMLRISNGERIYTLRATVL